MCSAVATEHDLYKNIRDINAYTDFKMIEVKVPIIFSCTVGFALRREGRYSTFIHICCLEC